VFLGTHTPRLDEKGRLFLPARWRDELADGVVITRGQEHCLYVWPRAEFTRFTQGFRDVPLSNKGVRDFQRMLFAGASDEVPDKQGRVIVPAGLRTYAGLERDCVVIGAMSRIEIWDVAAWDRYQEAHESSFADVSEEVLPGLI
jgi:MraZ protein